MREVLTNPIHGFYIDNETVLGSKGHFVTSPEIRWVESAVRLNSEQMITFCDPQPNVRREHRCLAP